MQNNQESTGDKISDFVQKNRKAIFTLLGVFVCLLVGSVVFFSLQDYLQKKAIAKVEDLNEKFSKLKDVLADEDKADEVQALYDEVNSFVKGKSGIAAARGWAIMAQIKGGAREWESAEIAWSNAAKTGRKTYLGPIAYFNAAAAAEEQGSLERAIGYLENSVSLSFSFPQAPRAQFNLGRLYEQTGDSQAAIVAYRDIIRNWPAIEQWTNLAQSRIIALELNESLPEAALD
jgi:tetratricopeptide (TPR) repeat protein